MTAKRWTEAECEFLRKNYQTMSNKELAGKFKVTEKSVGAKLRKLKLKRDRSLGVSAGGYELKKLAVKRKVDRSALHCNIRCRICLIVDGYTEKEEACHFCDSKLFKHDVL